MPLNLTQVKGQYKQPIQDAKDDQGDSSRMRVALETATRELRQEILALRNQIQGLENRVTALGG